MFIVQNRNARTLHFHITSTSEKPFPPTIYSKTKLCDLITKPESGTFVMTVNHQHLRL